MIIRFENATLKELTIKPSDDKVKEYTEALVILGFEPRVEMEE